MDAQNIAKLMTSINRKIESVPMKTLTEAIQGHKDFEYLCGLFDVATDNSDMIQAKIDKIKERYEV